METPLATDQINLTDEECRIMPVADGGFEQCYSAQAIAAAKAVQAPNDKQQLVPMLGKLADLPVELGKMRLADNGHFSE